VAKQRHEKHTKKGNKYYNPFIERSRNEKAYAYTKYKENKVKRSFGN